jgi:uncharacterized repeat protein (TIGR03806 family)
MIWFDRTERTFTASTLCLLTATFCPACGTDGDQGGNGGPDAAITGGAANGSGGVATGGAVSSGGRTDIGGTAPTGGSPTTGGASNAEPDASVAAKCVPPASVDAPLEKLSDTGCMDASAPTKFAALVTPYEVNSPLWSDSADKTRGMRLPDNKKIHVQDCAKEPALCTSGTADTGKWVFPVGTVMVKSFMFDTKLVETRLFVHFDATTWVGYSYAWNEAQTEATIVPDERKQVQFQTGKRTVEWNYPNRFDCMKCHNDQSGATLGPETDQMNRVVGGKNQIDALAALGFFETPPAKPYAAALVTPYAGQAGTPPASATVEQRARSYLQANCAFCHRPDGDFPSLDMRLGTAFKDMGLCNVAPLKGDVGVVGALDLVPKKPDQSVVWLRMNALPDNGRMPQIGTNQVDTDGVALVGDWIKSIASCP